ncbi:MAG: hypothetical protein ACM3O7_03425 [Acidobacteriota bacterium]
MKSLVSRDAMAPAVHPVTAAVVTVLVFAMAGLIYLGYRGVASPPATATPTQAATVAPTPTPTASPGIVALDPQRLQLVIDGNIKAWCDGDRSVIPSYYASDAKLRWLSEAPGSFEITGAPTGCPYVNWQRTGPVFGEGSIRAHASLYSTMASEATGWVQDWGGFVVYRFDRDGRIEVEWAILLPLADPHPGVASSGVDALLGGCLEALKGGVESLYLDCYAPDAISSISSGSPDGAWTARYVGIDAIAEAFGRSVEAGTIIEMTGDVIMQGNLVAFPFRQSSSAGITSGIDVSLLSTDRMQILQHWVFSSP